MILTPLLAPLLAFAIHAVANRLFLAKSQQRLCMLCSVLAGLIVVGVTWADPLQNLWCAVTAMGFSYCYFHLFNISETGLRPQMLRRLAQDPRLGAQSLVHLYDDQSRMAHRLARLEAFGAIERQEGGFVLKPSLLGLAGRIFCHPWIRNTFDYQ